MTAKRKLNLTLQKLRSVTSSSTGSQFLRAEKFALERQQKSVAGWLCILDQGKDSHAANCTQIGMDRRPHELAQLPGCISLIKLRIEVRKQRFLSRIWNIATHWSHRIQQPYVPHPLMNSTFRSYKMQCGGKDCSLVQTQAFFLSNFISSLSSRYITKQVINFDQMNSSFPSTIGFENLNCK
jgi:hypothetical protein